ncbi:MAG: AEC family transporter [Oscillospiraceae bacterium]|nr:AEC family transporter [Oscillospiraceae bacterium]
MLNSIFYMLLLIAIGFLLHYRTLLGENGDRFLSTLLMTLCFPAMILKSFLTVDPGELLSTGLSTTVVTVVFSLLPAVVLLSRKNKMSQHSLYSFICGIGNVSFVCIPLLGLFLTETEMLTVYLHVSVQDVLIWGLFHPSFAGSSRPKEWKKLLTEPCLLAVMVGLLLCATGLTLPNFLMMSLDALDACVSPLALVFLGMTVARYGRKGSFFKKTPILYTLYKVVAYPTVLFMVLYFFLPLKEAILMAILFGSPAPVASVVWMQRYTEDPFPAISCLVPSTVLYFLLYTPLLVFLCSRGIFGI